MNIVTNSELQKLIDKLSAASEKRQMSVINDHPWDEELTSNTWLKKRSAISIYGTEYYDLATEEELRLLSIQELGSWWHGFILLERLGSEYYLNMINSGAFDDRPEIHSYLHHFIREEMTHSIVFYKAMEHFNIELFPDSELVSGFFADNAKVKTGKYPLMNVYLTVLIEWVADLIQRSDVNGDDVSPLAKAVVVEHGREEARHITWGCQTIMNLAHEDEAFLAYAREFTPIFLKDFFDQGVTNIECFNRVGFKHLAFQEEEKLIETVLNSENTRLRRIEILTPVIRYLVKSGIYHSDYDDLWEMTGLIEIVKLVKQQKEEKEVLV